jgi:hypothetical protein
MLTVFVAAGASHADIIGVTWEGDVVAIHSATGSNTRIGSTGFIHLNSLAQSSSGALFTVGARPGAPEDDQLIMIDPVTGAGHAIATISGTIEGPSIRSMAFSPSGDLIAANWGSALYKIDTTTGVASFLGPAGFGAAQSLAFSANGILYSHDNALGLFTINPTTGAGTRISSVSQWIGLQSLAFSSSQELYGISGSVLYRLDTTTGWATWVGTGATADVRGMEFVPAVPLPSAIWAGIGLLGLIGIIQWKKRTN